MSTATAGRIPLQQLYLFPRFQTREAYRTSTGMEPPEFNSARPPKYWFDPQAATSQRRNVVYDNVVAFSDNGAPLADAHGKPYTDLLVLSRDEAATVNIPPSGINVTNVKGADVPEVPVPMRQLLPNEELSFSFGGTVVVIDKTKAEDAGQFTNADRQLLMAIASKLGVSIS